MIINFKKLCCLRIGPCCDFLQVLLYFSQSRASSSLDYTQNILFIQQPSDLQPTGPVAGSSPVRSSSRNDFGQVVHTHVPLFTKQYKLAPTNGRDAL